MPAAIWPRLPKDAPRNRLGLAKWLVDPANPLTARVTVNRFWQQYFGTGIVKTAAGFRAQGEWPTHPELLDWLATEFVRSGWDVKQMQRLIVTSATYRQSSNATAEDAQRDAANDPAGPRVRDSASTPSDSRLALAVSGLLVEQDRRPERQALSAGRIVGGRGIRGQQHVRLQARQGSRAVSPQPVHVLEADLAAAVADHVRRPVARRHAPCAVRAPTRRCRRWC